MKTQGSAPSIFKSIRPLTLLVVAMSLFLGACVLQDVYLVGGISSMEVPGLGPEDRAASIVVFGNAPVTSSSSSVGYPGTNLTDGDILTYWMSSPGTTKAELTVDIKRTQYCDRIVLYPLPRGRHFPGEFRILLSKDGNEWVTAVSEEDYISDGSPYVFRLGRQVVRYARIEMSANAVPGSTQDRLALSQIGLFYDEWTHRPISKAVSGATYHVSSTTGDDQADGLSPETAWRTLAKASQFRYGSGNKLLLRQGDIWQNETLFFHADGSLEEPALLSSYGTGPRPRIHAGMGKAVGVKLVNSSGVRISGLEFSTGASGILAVSDRQRNVSGLIIDNCRFHDITTPIITHPDIIMPYAEQYFGAGICIAAFAEPSLSGATFYRDILIENCEFERCDTGILNTLVDGPLPPDGRACEGHFQFDTKAMVNVVIRDVRIEKSYRSGGIMLYGAKDSLIERAYIADTGYEKGMWWGTAACQLSMCEDTIVRDSEFTRTWRSNNSPDGEGFDFESGNKNVVLQNCWIHNNQGPAILMYGQNIGWKGWNHGNVIEDNLLEDNGEENAFDHSKVFKNYPENSGIIRNNRIILRFDGQPVTPAPHVYSATNYVIASDGRHVSGPGVNPLPANDPAVRRDGFAELEPGNKSGHLVAQEAGATVKLRFYGDRISLAADGPANLWQLKVDGVPVAPGSGDAEHPYRIDGLEENHHDLELTALRPGLVLRSFSYSFGPEVKWVDQDNLARSATITASSSMEGWGWSVRFLNNGIRSSLVDGSNGWSSNSQLNRDHEEWVLLDFGRTVSLREVVLYASDKWPSYENPGMGLHFPRNLLFETSLDGEVFIPVLREEGLARPKNNANRFAFPSVVAARYLKLTGNGLRPNPAERNLYRMQFAEIVVR